MNAELNQLLHWAIPLIAMNFFFWGGIYFFNHRNK
jgi:hypothetical protein